MNREQKVYENLDPKIKSVLNLTNGWLVGNAVFDILTDRKPDDYDIVVNSPEFHTIIKSLTVTYKFTINNYGGFKFYIDDFVLDVWTEDLSHFLLAALNFNYAYNFKSRLLIGKI